MASKFQEKKVELASSSSIRGCPVCKDTTPNRSGAHVEYRSESCPSHHRVCMKCIKPLCEQAMEASRASGVEPRIACAYPKCMNQWNYDDMIRCPFKELGAYVEQYYVQLAFSRMNDAFKCPWCQRVGWLVKDVCSSAGCPYCSGVYCTGCQQKSHYGHCGGAQDEPELANDPTRIFNLDQALHGSTDGNLKQLVFSTNRPTRSDLFATERGVAFTLARCINQYAAEQLRILAEKIGFQSLEAIFPNDYRSNDRLLARSTFLAEHLFSTVSMALKPADLRRVPMGPTGEGLWIPHAVNPVFKFARYRPSCSFTAHRDGLWAPSIDVMSMFTLVIYLNSVQIWDATQRKTVEFDGGETRFYADNDKDKVLASVKPQQGMGLLFTQDLLHDGAVIKSGVKYILRTEVLYRRVRSVLDRAPSVLAASEDLQRITAAYKASCEAEERGDKDKFLEYLVAIELQAKRPPPAPKLPIPDDVLIEVFMYLSDRELLGNVGRVSKWMYRLSRDNALWSKRMHLVYPTVAAYGRQDLSVDWLTRYRLEASTAIEYFCCGQYLSLDIGSGCVKLKYGDTTIVRPVYYRMVVKQYWSHGIRNEVDVMSPISLDEAMPFLNDNTRPLASKQLLRAVKENGLMTEKGREFVRTLVPRFDNRGRLIVVLRDDFEEPLMHQHLILNCPAQNLRFVSHSAAVCHLHGVKSAVVVSLGQNNRCLVAVRNLVPTHVLPLENISADNCLASVLVIARLIHQVLVRDTPLFPDLDARESAIKSQVLDPLATSGATSDAKGRFIAAAQEKLAQFVAANPNHPDSARNSVEHRVIFTGGWAFHHKDFLEEIKRQLAAMSPDWTCIMSDKPYLDAILGAASLTYASPLVFRYGTMIPAVTLPPMHFPLA